MRGVGDADIWILLGKLTYLEVLSLKIPLFVQKLSIIELSGFKDFVFLTIELYHISRQNSKVDIPVNDVIFVIYYEIIIWTKIKKYKIVISCYYSTDIQHFLNLLLLSGSLIAPPNLGIFSSK